MECRRRLRNEIEEDYHAKMAALVSKYPALLAGVEGDSHMTALRFHTVDAAVSFCTIMNHDRCVDVSAQTYKPNCPPVALTKLPLITSKTMMDALLGLMDGALAQTAKAVDK